MLANVEEIIWSFSFLSKLLWFVIGSHIREMKQSFYDLTYLLETLLQMHASSFYQLLWVCHITKQKRFQIE